jgi:hypothetical protein
MFRVLTAVSAGHCTDRNDSASANKEPIVIGITLRGGAGNLVEGSP